MHSKGTGHRGPSYVKGATGMPDWGASGRVSPGTQTQGPRTWRICVHTVCACPEGSTPRCMVSGPDPPSRALPCCPSLYRRCVTFITVVLKEGEAGQCRVQAALLGPSGPLGSAPRAAAWSPPHLALQHSHALARRCTHTTPLSALLARNGPLGSRSFSCIPARDPGPVGEDTRAY